MSTIDSDEFEEVTIDGDEVEEITMDGDVVWEASTIPHEDDLLHEYRADTLDSSHNDGDAVSTWEDQAGTADLTQSTSSEQPTYRSNEFNGYPAVEFYADDPDFVSDSSPNITQPFTVYVAHLPGGTGEYFVVASDDSQSFIRCGGRDNADESGPVGLNAGTLVNAGDMPTETETVIGAVFDGSNSRPFMDPNHDGNYDDTTGDAGTNDFGGIRIGTNSAGFGSDNTVWHAHVLIYDGAHTQTERDDVIAYLHDYYGIGGI